jgi:hypothetical protein
MVKSPSYFSNAVVSVQDVDVSLIIWTHLNWATKLCVDSRTPIAAKTGNTCARDRANDAARSNFTDALVAVIDDIHIALWIEPKSADRTEVGIDRLATITAKK